MAWAYALEASAFRQGRSHFGSKDSIQHTASAFSDVCNQIEPYVVEHRCWNQVALHTLFYYAIRQQFPSIGSQMVCNAIKKVCAAYKALRIKKSQRTYSLKDGILSLFSMKGRVRCAFRMGKHQERYLAAGVLREGELVQRGKRWFFNVVVKLPDVVPLTRGTIMAVDLVTSLHGVSPCLYRMKRNNLFQERVRQAKD